MFLARRSKLCDFTPNLLVRSLYITSFMVINAIPSLFSYLVILLCSSFDTDAGFQLARPDLTICVFG